MSDFDLYFVNSLLTKARGPMRGDFDIRRSNADAAERSSRNASNIACGQLLGGGVQSYISMWSPFLDVDQHIA
jgi:hypothetical protein